MKKIFVSVILINLLVACSIHTPFDSPSAPKQESASPTPPAPEAAKVDSATTADVNEKPLDQPIAAETPANANAAPIAEAAAEVAAEAAPKAEAAPAAEPTPQPVSTEVDPLNDPASVLSKRSIHFLYDSDVVQDADKATIKAHGAYLANHFDRKIRVEGNTDERGSSEYNLALGQRRANNTKKSLVLAGAKPTQIDAISFGEEKPLAAGHDEASWAQNRRSDLNYK